MTRYTEQIRHYANNLDYVGQLAGADGIGEIGLGEGERGSRIAVRFFLKIARQQIDSVRFQAFGCGYTIAACAATAELAEKALLAEIKGIRREAIDARLGGLPSDRGYCADLAAAALWAAVVSFQRNGKPVAGDLSLQQPHGEAKVSDDDPRYRQLMDSPCTPDVLVADRHLLACLIVVMEQEDRSPETVLGLTREQFSGLCSWYFPAIQMAVHTEKSTELPNVAGDPELVNLLLGYVAEKREDDKILSGTILARILATRAAVSGHLWVAMGLFSRSELSAAINQHLPTLFAANHQGMRWKRFFYKQICDQNGGMLCKSPVCGDCSEYSLCFAVED